MYAAISEGSSTLQLTIDNALFTHEGQRIRKAVDSLVEKSDRLQSEQNKPRRYGFLYAGVFYRHSAAPEFHASLPALDLSLWDEMTEIEADKAQLEDDRQKFRQLAFSLFEIANTDQDLRDLLPECLAPLVPGLRNFNRSRPEGSMFEEHPRAKKLFDKLLPRMEFYAATRLFY